MMKEARDERYIPESMYERITGKEKASQKEEDVDMEWRAHDGMTAKEWQAAVEGNLKDAGARKALRKMWHVGRIQRTRKDDTWSG